MASIIETAAAGVVGPKLVRNFRFSWLVYGAVAYFGIRYLNKKGVMPKQTGMAMNAMNRGIDTAKGHLGLKTETPQPDNVVH